VGEECINEEELRNLLKHKPHPVAYDGFEPSGRMHIAQVCTLHAWPGVQLQLTMPTAMFAA
jgi:tyrosyl-tRNA synthetase